MTPSKETLKALSDTTPLKPPLSFYPTSRIRSSNFSVRGGKLLTDRKIAQYAREGFYGTEVQERARMKNKPKKRMTLAQAMKLLAGL